MRCLLFLAPIGKLPQANIQNGSHGGTDERTGSRQDRVSDHGTPRGSDDRACNNIIDCLQQGWIPFSWFDHRFSLTDVPESQSTIGIILPFI